MEGKYERLEELIRKVKDIMQPGSHEELVQSLSKEGMAQYYKLHPNCFLRIEDVLFPLCGRGAVRCPKMIAFSLRMARALIGNENIDQQMLAVLMQKLERLKGRYEKEVPTPFSTAAKKANSTRLFNKNMS